MEKVNLFIVGAMKSGTTSLYEYLMQHKDIFLPKEKKEMNYFATIYQKIPHADKNAYDLHDKKSIYTEEEYEKFYYKRNHEKILVDVSPEYLYYYQCAKDIYEYNKDAKIIILLRNPVNRAFSAYTHLRRDLSEENSFIDAFMQSSERKEKNYIALYDLFGGGLYADGVEQFINIFGKENVKVIIFEEFINDTQRKMNEICEFLDINLTQFDCSVKYNESGIIQDKKKMLLYLFFEKKFYRLKKLLNPTFVRKIKEIMYNMLVKNNMRKIQISEKDRKIIAPYYVDNVRRLEKILGRKIDCWNL